MKRPVLRLINWLLDKLMPAGDPFPLEQKHVEWEQRHAHRTVGEIVESQGTILPPPRGQKRR